MEDTNEYVSINKLYIWKSKPNHFNTQKGFQDRKEVKDSSQIQLQFESTTKYESSFNHGNGTKQVQSISNSTRNPLDQCDRILSTFKLQGDKFQCNKECVKDICDKIDEILQIHFDLSRWDISIAKKEQLLAMIDCFKNQNKFTKAELSLINWKLKEVNSQFNKIDQEYQILQENVRNIDSCDWKLYQTEKNIKLYYMNSECQKQLVLKTEAVLNANMITLISLIRQIEYAQKWMPMLRYFEQIGFIDGRSTTRIINGYFGALGVKRTLQAAVYGVDRLQHNNTSIMIINDISDNVQLMKNQNVYDQYQKFKGDTKIKVYQMVYIYEYLDQNRCKVTFIQNMDINMSFVPKFLGDYISKKSGITMLQNLQTKATRRFEHSIWADCILNRDSDYHSKRFYEQLNNVSIEYMNYNYIDDLSKKTQSNRKK